MTTIKSYTSIEQSRKLAEILPLESADMVLPFRHTKNDEYIPEHVVSRNYVEVYNEMIKLPGMGKEDICQLIQPAWSLAALLGVLPKIINNETLFIETSAALWHIGYRNIYIARVDNPIDACYELILKLHEFKIYKLSEQLKKLREEDV